MSPIWSAPIRTLAAIPGPRHPGSAQDLRRAAEQGAQPLGSTRGAVVGLVAERFALKGHLSRLVSADPAVL